MRLSELTLPSTTSEAETILSKWGWKYIGAGEYATVYWKAGRNYVLKMFKDYDMAYLDFIDVVKLYPNKHFPVFRGKIHNVIENYYTVRMEKLYPVHDTLISKILSDYIIARNNGWDDDYIENSEYSPMAADARVALGYLQRNIELKNAMDILYEHLFEPNGYTEDFHSGNIMQRADGTIVIIDPADA